jgi:AraC family transcriptional regulator
MSNLNLIAQSINYIETNLKNKMTVVDVADAIGYSLYHFSRLFHGVTGHSPKDYILRRRLTEAAYEILASKQKITTIAMNYQFNDSETFCRAFKRTFGINPTELRRCVVTTQLPFLNAINLKTIYHRDKIKAAEPELVELAAIHLIGLTVFEKGHPKLITELWAQFPHDLSSIKNRLIPEKFYQVTFWPNRYDLNGYFLMCSVAVADLQNINVNLVGKEIPSAKYLRFIHRGCSSQVGLTYQYIYETWLPKSDYRLSLPYNLEYYGENFLGPNREDSESEIYIPIELPHTT